MFPTFLTVPLHFTVEFLGLLVTAGGAFLVASRPALIPGSRFNRVAGVAGFAALAAAQVAHGGSFVVGDAEWSLGSLRAVGYALIALGIGRAAIGSRAAAAATLGPSLASGVASLLLAFAAIGAFVKSRARIWLRLAGAGLLFSGADLIGSQASGDPIGIGVTDGYAYASHAARLGAYLFLGSWLWTGVRSSIRTRFVASFVTLLVAIVLALSTTLTGVISNSVEEAELARVKDQVGNVVANVQEQERQDVLTAVRVVANAREFRTEFAALLEARRPLDSLAADLLNPDIFAVDFVVIRDARAGIYHAGHAPAKNTGRGTVTQPLADAQILKIIGSATFSEVLGAAPEAAGIDKIGKSIAILAVSDVRTIDESDEIGTVVLGRWVDARTTEQLSESLFPVRASLVVDGTVVATELGDVGSGPIVPGAVASRLAGGTDVVAQQQAIGGSTYYSAFAPIRRGDGAVLAHVVLSSPARIVERSRSAVTRTLFLVAMGVAAVSLVLAWLSGRRITRPIQQLTSAAVRVREGDLDVQAQVAGGDEVGQLGETFNEMTAAIRGMTSDLREAALEESRLRARIETIIQSMADGLVAVGPDRRVLAFNRQAEKLTGLKAKAAMGKPIQEVLDVRDVQRSPVDLPVFRLAGGSTGGVFLNRKDGPPIPVAITSAVLSTEQREVTGAVAVIRDTSREHEVERMKTQFLSNISHELRTPLTPIKGYAEILHKKTLPREKSQQFVKGIIESTDRLERIVDLLVDFSALEAGRLAPRSTPVDVGAMLEELAETWERRTPKHKVVADVKARLPRVPGDERLLRRSIEELLDNAVKFSPHGGTITLEARAVSAGNGAGDGKRRYVAVTVADQGIGITADDREKIFSDFQQLDGSDTRSFGGLGLGLAFVRRIVDAHRGAIRVESEPDRGTRLTISLPAAGRARGN